MKTPLRGRQAPKEGRHPHSPRWTPLRTKMNLGETPPIGETSLQRIAQDQHRSVVQAPRVLHALPPMHVRQLRKRSSVSSSGKRAQSNSSVCLGGYLQSSTYSGAEMPSLRRSRCAASAKRKSSTKSAMKLWRKRDECAHLSPLRKTCKLVGQGPSMPWSTKPREPRDAAVASSSSPTDEGVLRKPQPRNSEDHTRTRCSTPQSPRLPPRSR